MFLKNYTESLQHSKQYVTNRLIIINQVFHQANIIVFSAKSKF